MENGTGLVAVIGGFILLVVIIAVTLWTKARKPTRNEQIKSDQATRDNFDKSGGV